MNHESDIYRYPGVQPFDEHQQSIFFGRSEDVDNLTSIIILEKLTILFGKSGYGKSSIINAGVIPSVLKQNLKQRNKFYPYLIRFQPYIKEECKSLVEKFIFNLNNRDQLMGVDVKDRDYLPKSIWGELKRRQNKYNDCFVLLFDQFEEVFTYPVEEQIDFIAQIADLLYSDVPAYLEEEEEKHTQEEVELMIQKMDCRVVFTIRSDRMSELDKFKNNIPHILNRRYELKALKLTQAKEALLIPSKLDYFIDPDGKRLNFVSPGFDWLPDSIDNALEKLIQSNIKKEEGVEAFQLQILAQYIEQKIISKDIADKNDDGIQDVGVNDLPSLTNLYERFYEDALKSLTYSERKLSEKLIEKGLIFEDDNQRITVHEKVIYRDFKVDRKLIEKLTNLRLLRSEISTTGGHNIELSHDAFVRPILVSAQKRKSRAKKRKISILSSAFTLFVLLIGAIIFFKSAPFGNIESYDAYVKYNYKIDSLSNTLARVEEKKQELNTKVKTFEIKIDSINMIASDERYIKSIILQYLDCINKKDEKCISGFVSDTMYRYYRVKNIQKREREKLERQYFNRHSAERIVSINDVIVKKDDSNKGYTVNASTVYYYDDKGITPVIYKFNIDKNMKINSLTAFIQGDK